MVKETMSYYSEKEKVEICLDIAKKLKFYENKDGMKVNLFNDSYSFIKKLKQVFNDYIKGTRDYRGVLEFEEIGKKINYFLPVSKKKLATFSIKMN